MPAGLGIPRLRTQRVLTPRSAQMQADFDKLLGVFATIIVGRTATYVSSPLTTGERLSDWLLQSSRSLAKGDDYDRQLRELVIEPNRQAAADFVARLRQESNTVVIAPTALPDMTDWSQEDYQSFWGQVIARYAAKVIFMNGWNYSSGCAYEFLISHKSGAHALDQDIRPLSLAKGQEMIRKAIKKFQVLGLGVDHLEKTYDALGYEAERVRTV